jgi:hypothetical protein
MHGNSVIGYKQYIDEEEHQKTITVRAIGTVVVLARTGNMLPIMVMRSQYSGMQNSSMHVVTESPSVFVPSESAVPTSLESEVSAVSEDISALSPKPIAIAPPMHLASKSFRQREPILLTLTSLPAGAIKGTGGFVCVAAIKVLDTDETNIRENWWTEARDEIKGHAKTLCCTHIIGYSEKASIYDDVVFMFCSGVAVFIDPKLLKLDSEEKGSGDLAPRRESFAGSEMFLSTIQDGKKHTITTEPGKLKKRGILFMIEVAAHVTSHILKTNPLSLCILCVVTAAVKRLFRNYCLVQLILRPNCN